MGGLLGPCRRPCRPIRLCVHVAGIGFHIRGHSLAISIDVAHRHGRHGRAIRVTHGYNMAVYRTIITRYVAVAP